MRAGCFYILLGSTWGKERKSHHHPSAISYISGFFQPRNHDAVIKQSVSRGALTRGILTPGDLIGVEDFTFEDRRSEVKSLGLGQVDQLT